MKQKLLCTLLLFISVIVSAQNPYVGNWDVIKRVVTRGSTTNTYTAPPIEAWVEFTSSSFTVRYGSAKTVIATGNYHLSGTTFVYDGGQLNVINITSFDGENNMQIHIEYYEDDTDKGGGYVLVKEDATLVREGTSGGGGSSSSVVISGTCGDNLTYTLDSDGTLSITGTGNMYNYTYNAQPWKDYYSQIKKLSIANGVTGLGNYAFNKCSALTTIEISNSVTTLGYNMFEGCTSLTSITLPSGISSISGYMFSNCANLKTVTCMAASVPTANVNTFYTMTLSDATLYVPASAVNAYKAANYWKDFGTILPIEGGETPTPTPDPQPVDSEIFTVSGNKIYCTAAYVTPSSGGLSGKGVQADDFRVVLYDKNNDKMSIEQGGASAFNFGTLDSYESYNYCLKSGGVANVELRLTFDKPGTLKIGARTQNKDDYSRGIRITQNGATILEEIVSENDIISSTKPYIYAFHTAKVEAGSATLTNFVGPISFYVLEFIPDGPQKCAKPSIEYENGKLRFYSDTPDVTFHSTITDSDIQSYDTDEIDLSVTYNVSVYATADGFENSDVTTVTLCWIDYAPITNSIQSTEISAQPVMIKNSNGVLQFSGLEAGATVDIYSVSGQQTNKAIATGTELTLDSHISNGNIAIVKINKKSVKIKLR